MIEFLVVVSIIIVFSVMAISSGKFLTQLGKGRDARRKANLAILQKTLEDYYGDKKQYPNSLPCRGDTLKPYLNIIPCDPQGGDYPYLVDSENQWYVLLAKLENETDPIIQKLACKNGCLVDSTAYNYLVNSPNLTDNDILDKISP